MTNAFTITAEAVKERWVPVSGYEEFYEVSDLGRVRSLDWDFKYTRSDGSTRRYRRNGKVLAGSTSRSYRTVLLRNKAFTVHGLVARAFLGDPPGPVSSVEWQVHHKDGDKANNRASNLEWIHFRDHLAETIERGCYPRGENATSAKLTRKEVRAIKGRISSGEMLKDIANDYPVSTKCISNIKLGRTWAHIEAA